MNLDDLNFEFREIADDRVVTLLTKIGNALAKIYTSIPKQVILPKIFQVQGKVEVVKQPAITIANFSEVTRQLQSLEQKLTIWAQAASTAQPPKIEFPKFDIPQNSPVDLSEVISSLNDLQDAFKGVKMPDNTVLQRKTNELLENLVNRPQMTPQPVTNITLNGLQGVLKTSDNTVGTTVVKLPNYGQLEARRSLQIYNNSANTIYYGGSDVTINNGIPITAGSFSAGIDAGYNMIVYAISASGGNDVRVIEVSKDTSGNIQE